MQTCATWCQAHGSQLVVVCCWYLTRDASHEPKKKSETLVGSSKGEIRAEAAALYHPFRLPDPRQSACNVLLAIFLYSSSARHPDSTASPIAAPCSSFLFVHSRLNRRSNILQHSPVPLPAGRSSCRALAGMRPRSSVSLLGHWCSPLCVLVAHLLCQSNVPMSTRRAVGRPVVVSVM